jgi:hypothetical protein
VRRSNASSIRMMTGALVIAAAAACAQTPEPQVAAPKPATPAGRPVAFLDSDAEAARVAAALRREVPGLIDDPAASRQAWLRRARAAIDAGDFAIDHPQFVVVVDRNPRVQQMRIVLARRDGPWRDLGGTRVSTGQAGRFDYYITPTGVFLHTDLILDWRALGTYNENHIRGLGTKGMRVWDFGWQTAAKGWGTQEPGEIRLLMHATDPAVLERRLGHPASKGCVRIPDAMNRFLDRHGILDADYQRAAKDDPRFAALLPGDRVPTPLAGEALVVVDSAQPLPAPAAQPAGPAAAAPPHQGLLHLSSRLPGGKPGPIPAMDTGFRQAFAGMTRN